MFALRSPHNDDDEANVVDGDGGAAMIMMMMPLRHIHRFHFKCSTLSQALRVFTA